MKIGILGTGGVGETLGGKLLELGHDVRLGSRAKNNEKAQAWTAKAGKKASSGTFEDAAAFGELLFNCTKGGAALDALKLAKEQNLAGKTLVDVSNPLDFSTKPPTLLVTNTDSLGEQIQRQFPKAKVVKALNTMWAGIMVNPRLLDGSTVFLCGNDAGAKAEVKRLLAAFGWRDDEVLDVGDITAARGTEAILPLWLRIMGAVGTSAFNLRVVPAKKS